MLCGLCFLSVIYLSALMLKSEVQIFTRSQRLSGIYNQSSSYLLSSEEVMHKEVDH